MKYLLLLLVLIQDPAPRQSGYLGIALEKTDGGVRVRDIPRGSPADRAGFKQGDLLVTINGTKIDDVPQVPTMIRAMDPGSVVAVEVRRDGKVETIRVTLGFLPGEAPPDAERDRIEKLKGDLEAAARKGAAVRAELTADGPRVTEDASIKQPIPLADAIAMATRRTGGRAVAAEFVDSIAEVTLLAKNRVAKVRLNAKVITTEYRDIPYAEGGAPKHRLDLFVPETEKPYPTVLWIHGGAWSLGDRFTETLLGRRFAERGVGFAAISYRLSLSEWVQPGGTKKGILHPEHVRDCAAAFAWLRGHVAEFGGDPEKLFVSGHSAGGHLAALMALDPKYLAAHKLDLETIKGAMPLDGAYDLVKYIEYIRTAMNETIAKRHTTDVFGPDEKALVEAAPTSYLKGCKVPMLVIFQSGDSGMPLYSADFKAAVEKEGIDFIKFREIPDRNHSTLRFKMEETGAETCRDAMIEFVVGRCSALDKPKK